MSTSNSGIRHRSFSFYTKQELQERLEQIRHERKRTERLEDIAAIGISMLENEDIKAANSWLRRHLKIWSKDGEVVRIDYL